MTQNIILVGAPMDAGKRRRGCVMGPDAYRTAGLAEAITAMGHSVTDAGNVVPVEVDVPTPDGSPIHALSEVVGWTMALAQAARDHAARGMPIFMGGDHALALGTVSGMAAHHAQAGRPFFVLWLDAHSDIHTPTTTASGNLHGTPVGYITGRPGFEAFPPLEAPVDPANICMIGLRSVDRPEHDLLLEMEIDAVDMRMIDETGIRAPLAAFLDRVRDAGGVLHVSLDVDFLDPTIAPAVGTTVPGGATQREAHLVMEMLCDSGLVGSLDLVELNPFLDERGKTALLMVDLTASLLGRRIFDRPTRHHG